MDHDAAGDSAYAPFSTPGNIRPYRREGFLLVVLTALGMLFWTSLTLLTLGTVWLAVAAGYLLRLIVTSCFTAYIRGNGVHVTERQFPELYGRFKTCCVHAGLRQRPEFYVLTGQGALNASAICFLRRYYVVLLTDIVDALHDDQDALNFYIGHELGHISQKHLRHRWWIGVVMLTPLIGTAYARAREYTCDQYGLACCSNTQSAVRALAVLAAGSQRWRSLNAEAYIAQSACSGGFWMSLNELTADCPWLCKRVACVQRGDAMRFPRRHLAAWLLAAMVPRTGFGIVGGLALYPYVAIAVAFVALPGFERYEQRRADRAARASLAAAYALGTAAARNVERFADQHRRLPDDVAQAGFDLGQNGVVRRIDIVRPGGALTVRLAPPHERLALHLTPAIVDGATVWICSADEGIASAWLPPDCRPDPAPADDMAAH